MLDKWVRTSRTDWFSLSSPPMWGRLWNLLTEPMDQHDIMLRLNSLFPIKLDYFATLDLLRDCEKAGVIERWKE